MTHIQFYKNLNFYLILIFALFIQVVNFIGHILHINEIMLPFEMGATMTLSTSLAMVFLYLSFLVPKIRDSLIIGAVNIQALSLILYYYPVADVRMFYESSSLPTTFLFFLSIFGLMLCEWKTGFERLKAFLGPLIFLITYNFFYAFLYNNYDILGIISYRTGIGLSFPTIISFFLLSLLICMKFTFTHPLHQLRFKLDIPSILIVSIAFTFGNLFSFFIKQEFLFVYICILHSLFLVCLYWLIFHPLSEEKTLSIKICSWTNNVQINDSNWMSLAQLLEKLGFKVTEGLSPEVAEKLDDQA